MDILVCTAVYEAGRPFIAPWCDGLAQAAAGFDGDIGVLLVSDGLAEPAQAFAAARRVGPVDIVPATGRGIVAVRRQLLALACRSDAAALVFFDMDDVPEPQAISAHATALHHADVSYGDLRLIDAGGGELAPSFFAGADVPATVSGANTLRYRNFIGFGNSAVRRAVVPAPCLAIPDDAIAPDWWFFTSLLRAGRTARQADGTVAAYRLHAGNHIGGRASAAKADVLARCKVALNHCRHFAGLPGTSDYAARIEALIAQLEAGSGPCQSALDAACRPPAVWYEDVRRLAAVDDPGQGRPTVSRNVE